MKASELNDLTIEELRSKGKETQETLFNLRFQHATGLLENTMRIPATKKDLARIKTILRSKSQDK
ncbi:MAG TPA: 50S ribosomal protein L29 [Thermodesulfobacteriota bacterium]|nr:50S ribosomal protein L29 [Thermodesulfobacteriota bacterium]